MELGPCGVTIVITNCPRRFMVVEVQQTFHQPRAGSVTAIHTGTNPEGGAGSVNALGRPER